VKEVEVFDVVVIGAGVGGMLAACQLGQAGKKVLLVENLSFLGGRFSGFRVDGAEVSTGAFHTIPHGRKGPFAQALRRAGVSTHISMATTLASFHVNGEHLLARTPIDLLKIFPSFKEKASVIRELLQSWSQKEYEGSFGEWLVELGMSDLILMVHDRFCQFALSSSVYDVPYTEGRKVIQMIIKYGLPGVPKGGAREVVHQLGLAAKRSGVIIRKNTRMQNLVLDGDHIQGVSLIDRRLEQTYTVAAPIVVSNMGPGNTYNMCRDSGLAMDSDRITPPLELPPAIGFKLQVLSPKSLVHHDSIMFCMDTQRVAGILQASNSDPDLAPPGKHLLISHQTIPPGADWQEERKLALADWAYLFGSDFDNCEVLGSSHFPARFPVNWASQGYDLREQVFAHRGLWMVGDGLKPEGLMMVEGVGANAEAVVRQILGKESASYLVNS
jgi:phytoene dehydrogenase-like protein